MTEDNYIAIVSGLPRSGTSMMMQILAAAGIENHTDNLRKADISNPKGYAEYEQVKSLQKDNSFLAEAYGKSLKVVAPLIPALDVNLKYKIVFIERSIDEVLNSQQVMLGKEKESYPPALKTAFQGMLNKAYQFADQNNIPYITVNHRDLLNGDLKSFESISKFFESSVDAETLLSCVDKSLHRQKK